MGDARGAGAAAGAGAPRALARRWLMLALFAATSAANAAHWLQFAIVAGAAQRFYGVGPSAINWTSMVFMAAYVPLVFPASWITDKKGLRVAVALGAGLTALGGWLKVVGSWPDRFAVAFAGQSLVGAAQMFTLGAPARLAALWFPPGQVATACALGVFGNQVGIAVGFVVPAAVVSADGSTETVSRELLWLHVGLAAAPTLLFVLILFLFEAAPPAASVSRAAEAEGSLGPEQVPLQPPPPPGKEPPPGPQDMADGAGAGAGPRLSFCASLRALTRNRDFVLLWWAYGLNVGVFYAVSTLLSQMLLAHFPGAEADAGRVGLAMVVAGVAGSVAGGLALDRWRRYKRTTLLVYALALAGLVAFAFALRSASLAFVYASAALLGFFTTGYLGVGYEYAAALTPGVPESTSSGMLNAASEVMGIALTLGAGEMLESTGDLLTNLTLTAVLALGFLLSALVRDGGLRGGGGGGCGGCGGGGRADAVEPVPQEPPEKFLS